MDFKAIMKKYWFVCVVGIALVAFIGIYAKDAYDNRELTVASKQVDGQYAVYSIDGDYIFADEFFDSLYEQNGLSVAFVQFQREILNGAYETTDEINDLASQYASYVYQYYGAEQVGSDLKQMGYVNGISDLTQYYVDAQKQNLLLTDYIDANWNTLYPAYETEEAPVMVKQILIKVADVSSTADEDGNNVFTANPTDEEKAKLDTVLAKLKAGKTFEEVQEAYNEDGSNTLFTVSNSNGSNYVSIFTNTAKALAVNETSEVVTSTYGYHILKRYEASKENLLASTDFMEDFETYYSNLSVKAVMAKAEELGYEIVDEELANLIKTQLESEVAE